MNQNSFETDRQCELSYELLYLLKWLAEREGPTLKKLVAKAINNGLQEELSHSDRLLSSMNSESIQTSIVDFLDLLDSLLLEGLTERSFKKALVQNLIPAINKIDSHACDKTTVQYSVKGATDHLEHDPNMNAQELLFKELLKHWKPENKKKLLN